MIMNKNTSFTLLLLFLVLGSKTILAQDNKIHWLTWEQALAKSKVEKRMIVVDVYTQWCGWCKRMDKNTFQQKEVAQYINEHYYPIRFDAEYKEPIHINEKEYRYVPSGRRGYHELAAAITFGKLSFPTIVFLDENWKVIQPIPGYQNAKTFKLISQYFAEGHYKTTPWDKFKNTNSY